MEEKVTEKVAPPGRRYEQAAARRLAIIEAALEEFVQNGFAGTRMDDIARRAGVAKGTVYLYFQDKEALFKAIVEQEIQPKINVAAAVAQAGGSLEEFLENTMAPMLRGWAGTRRGALLRLLIGEAGHFPKLAEVYFQLVVAPGMEAIRTLSEHSIERGELRNGSLAEFPQLVIAPLLLAVLWGGMFERFQHLDVEGMARAYFGAFRNGGPGS